jgi:hypothetical protein
MQENDNAGYAARPTMLFSGEFDPIEDADSNYGRVLDIKSVSRTNPSIPEDMDVSPERKASLQQLYDIDGPQRTDAPRCVKDPKYCTVLPHHGYQIL